MSGVCDVRWCDCTSTELVTFAGQCIGKFCLYHQHQLMRAAGQTVPPAEGRAGYLRFCSERGITPVPWWDEP